MQNLTEGPPGAEIPLAQSYDDYYNMYGMYPGYPVAGYPGYPPSAYGTAAGYPVNPYGYPFPMGMDGASFSAQPTHTVWIGGLGTTTDQELFRTFGQFGNVENVKILPQKNCAFVRFTSVDDAIRAHAGMTGKTIGGQPIKLGWGKPDSTKEPEAGPPPCRNLWVGNIEPGCTEEQVREAFKSFGPIEKIRVLPHKNCAFVNFEHLDSALEAKKQMQGAPFMGKSLRVNFGKSLDSLGDEDEEAIQSQLGPSQPPAPANQRQREVIDKLAAYIVKSGPHLEDVTREKQSNNPLFSFLKEDGEYYEYYKWKIFEIRQKQKEAESPWNLARNRIFNPPNATGKPLSNEEKSALSQILDTLTPTKESIKKGKDYIMSLPEAASSICQFMCQRIKETPDFTARLNIIYLANDVLHHSIKPDKPSQFAEALYPYLPCILHRTYHMQSPENQSKLSKILLIWKTKNVYSESKITELEGDMTGDSIKAPPPPLPAPNANGNNNMPPEMGAYHAVPPPNMQQGKQFMNNLDSFLSQMRTDGSGQMGMNVKEEGQSFKNERKMENYEEKDNRNRNDRRDRERDRERDRDEGRGKDRERERDREGKGRDRERERDRDRDDRKRRRSPSPGKRERRYR